MRTTYSALTLLAVATLFITTGCNPLNKMNKKHGLVKYTLQPNPLEMHGDSVTINVSGRYPEKFFHKKAVANVKPVMLDQSGNVVKEFETIKLIGEVAEGEGTRISWSGGSFNVSNQVPYESSMENVQLVIQVEAGYKTKTKTFDPVPIGKGTVVTPLLVQSDEKPMLGKDNFTKVSPRKITAEIHYLIQSSYVRPEELRQDDINAVEAFLDKGIKFEYEWKSVDVTSYASPDGETSLNENLAGDRAKTATQAMMGLFRKKKIEAGTKEALYKKNPKGEDWQGFKEKMEASNIADKEMILRILSMYSDDKKREQEIKNLAATYKVIAEEILPPLRRSVITINAEEKAKTDEELKKLVKENPAELTIEEILYTATLYNDLNDKLEVYKAAAKVHPGDWRGPNNIGWVYVQQNKISEAKAEFEKAVKLAPSEKVVLNNLGVVSRLMGDTKTAMSYYTQAKGAGKEVNYNIGIVQIMKGNYEDAVSNMSGFNTFNAALANVLNGNNEAALNIIEASDAKATALGYYLKAIIGARTNNQEMVVNNLKAAFEKDSSLKKKAANDAEFLDYRDNSAVSSLWQ
ncbi:MAG: tetratricopeptide repeat protein [Salibacteraceae bacterium]